MAYSAVYEEGDIAEGTLNIIVKGILTVSSFLTLIVVVFLYIWVRKHMGR